MDNIKDIYGHITDRMQKLTAALYRVTDLLSDKEPLKWTLRDNAVNMYEALIAVKFVKDRNSVLQEALDRAHQIIKSLELVSAGTCISNLNFEILKREYLYIKNLLEGKKTDLVFDQKLLPEFSVQQKKNKEQAVARGARQDFSGMPAEEAGLPVRQAGSDTPQKLVLPREDFENSATFANAISPQSRKGKILDFLKDKESRTVSEIGVIFNGGVSDKAIQRDLFDLVKIGKIGAIGDKRWRKYEIIEGNDGQS